MRIAHAEFPTEDLESDKIEAQLAVNPDPQLGGQRARYRLNAKGRIRNGRQVGPRDAVDARAELWLHIERDATARFDGPGGVVPVGRHVKATQLGPVTIRILGADAYVGGRIKSRAEPDLRVRPQPESHQEIQLRGHPHRRKPRSHRDRGFRGKQDIVEKRPFILDGHSLATGHGQVAVDRKRAGTEEFEVLDFTPTDI